MINRDKFFREVTFIVTESLDIEKVLKGSLNYISEVFPADYMFIEIFNPMEGTVKIYAYSDLMEARKIDKVMHIPKEFRDLMKPHNQDINRVMILNDFGKNPLSSLITTAIDHKGNSGLVVPLHIEGNLLGALIIEAKGLDRYGEEDADLASLLIKPFSISLSNALKLDEVKRLSDIILSDKKALERDLLSYSGDKIIGADYGLKSVMEQVRRVAKTDSPVLILGETGVGKDIIANAIHYESARSEEAMVRVNSGAIPRNLIDSELFGYEKGSFTGAISQKRGRFERANKGTLFLDEIGELTPDAQVRLLRVLQNREIERIGGTEAIPVDVRIIAATHRNLPDMITEGSFREDLWFRLNVFPIVVPPLRERKEDIPSLINYLLNKKSVELRLKDVPPLDSNSLKLCIDYPWPGNVRELENIIERALITYSGGSLRLNPEGSQAYSKNSVSDGDLITLDAFTKKYIERVLDSCSGVIHGDSGAAKILNVKPTTLRYKMDKLGVEYRKQLR